MGRSWEVLKGLARWQEWVEVADEEGVVAWNGQPGIRYGWLLTRARNNCRVSSDFGCILPPLTTQNAPALDVE
jgi:hypothetical protein